MTNKDYTAIADILIEADKDLDCDLTDKQFAAIIAVFAKSLAKQPNFSVVKFFNHIYKEKQ